MTFQTFLTPDLLNGIFESGAALAIANNAWKTWQDKQVKGVSIWSTCFFTSWGFFNPGYYWNLHQIFSFGAGILVVLANVAWLSLMWKFRNSSNPVVLTPTEPSVMNFDAVCEALDKQGGVSSEVDTLS